MQDFEEKVDAGAALTGPWVGERQCTLGVRRRQVAKLTRESNVEHFGRKQLARIHEQDIRLEIEVRKVE